MQTTIAEHPLALSFRRARQRNENVRASLERPAGDGWVRATAFFDQPHFEQRLRAVQRRYATRSQAVLAGVMLGGYQWGILAAGISCFLNDRRVPDLSPENLWLQWNEERNYVSAVAFTSGRFAALPEDPAATHPDAYLLGDVDSLREHLRCQIEAHLEMAIEQLVERLAVNPRSMWPFVADRCASMVLWLGKGLEGSPNQYDIEREVDALIKVPGSPLNNGVSGTLPVSCQGITELFLRRAACCYNYRLKARDYCRTCPRLPQEERIDRLQELMQEKTSS